MMKGNNNSTRTTVGARLGAGVGATGAAVGANCSVLDDKRKKPKQQSKNQQYTTEQ
jgi:hypothetical protein